MNRTLKMVPTPPSTRASGEFPSPLSPDGRRALEVDVSLTSDSHFFVGLTNDLATGGVFVATYQPHAVGSHVEIELTLPTDTFRVSGIVRWVREESDGAGPGLGIALDPMTNEERSCIDRFCLWRSPLYYDFDELDAAS